MRRYSTTIGLLMRVTAVFAVGMAALFNSSAAWATIMTLSMTILLLLAGIAVVYRTGRCRAGWIGFLIFGWGYILLSVLQEHSQEAPIDFPSLNRHILAQMHLKRNLKPIPGSYADIMDDESDSPYYVSVKVLEMVQLGHYKVQFSDGRVKTVNPTLFRQDNKKFYLPVGRSLLNLLFALIGSLVGILVYETRPRSHPNSERP